MGWWECPSCKTRQPSTAASCLNCAAKPAPEPVRPPSRSREQLPSFSGLIDTKSFVLPVRRTVVWVWIAIAFGLPLLLSLGYFLAGRLFR
jgi:hypothetical protein